MEKQYSAAELRRSEISRRAIESRGSGAYPGASTHTYTAVEVDALLAVFAQEVSLAIGVTVNPPKLPTPAGRAIDMPFNA